MPQLGYSRLVRARLGTELMVALEGGAMDDEGLVKLVPLTQPQSEEQARDRAFAIEGR